MAEITIEAHGDNIGSGNRIRRKDVGPLARRRRFENYHVVRVQPLIGRGEPMCLLTFVTLDHEFEVEVTGDTLESLRQALDTSTWQIS